MELEVGQNTYITIDECIELLNNYYGEDSETVTPFIDLDEEIQKSCIYRSFLDMQRLPYRGFKKEKDQKTAFPRRNKLGYESDPDMVKMAQAVNALTFMQMSGSDNTDSSMEKVLSYGKYGLKTYKLGSFSMSIDGNQYTRTAENTSKSGLVEELLRDWLKGSVRIV